jgi:hypothetical protein
MQERPSVKKLLAYEQEHGSSPYFRNSENVIGEEP